MLINFLNFSYSSFNSKDFSVYFWFLNCKSIIQSILQIINNNCPVVRSQRRAARFVKRDYQRTTSVTNILKDLGWDTLQHRRDIARATMPYKITNNLVDCVPDPPLRKSRSSRQHSQQYTQIRCAKSVYQHSFFPASVIIWNRLPQSVVCQPSLDGFKAAAARVRSI